MAFADKIDQADKRLSSHYSTEVPNEVIESQTVKIPNLAFLALAGVSIIGSVAVALRRRGDTDVANFVGHWAPTFMLFGLYNKMVKIESELLNLQKDEKAA
jgi:hypothetical protein